MKTIIGIDCSTNLKKLGICRAVLRSNELIIEKVVTGIRDPIPFIHSWITDATTLLAFDAPLGWPADLGKSLSAHMAGEAIDVDGNQLFRRATDRYVRANLGKQSLDVGADRIARTALWAVNFLNKLGHMTGRPISLAWAADFSESVAAIEVYPAATLLARGLALPGYKKIENLSTRIEILSGLASEMTIHCERAEITATDDALDSVICALAGYDFLENRCAGPEDLELARKESWIWFPEKGKCLSRCFRPGFILQNGPRVSLDQPQGDILLVK